MRKCLLKNDVKSEKLKSYIFSIGLHIFGKIEATYNICENESNVEFNAQSHLSLRVECKKITSKSDITAEF